MKGSIQMMNFDNIHLMTHNRRQVCLMMAPVSGLIVALVVGCLQVRLSIGPVHTEKELELGLRMTKNPVSRRHDLIV
jgi:uncharacterized membrane-anchored protein YhcB (DUF1043 family)